MKDLEFSVEKGETVTIVGSRPGGAGVVLAREIKKGQTSLVLSRQGGRPGLDPLRRQGRFRRSGAAALHSPL